MVTKRTPALDATGKLPEKFFPDRLGVTPLAAAMDDRIKVGSAPKWKPATVYTAGDIVLNPSGDTVTAIANFTSGATYDATKWNLSSAYAGVVKKVKGGALIKPIRVPTLHVEKEWPNNRSEYKILWAQGDTVYAEGADQTLRKSTDGGRTWTAKTFNFALSNYRGVFLKLASGALIQARNMTPIQFYRSTDDGATWTAGSQCRANGLFLTAQSWAQDPVTGYVYAVEYHTSDTIFADVRVYRSTDDGVTFSVWYTFPGPTSTDPKKVRHGHSVQWDAVSQRIYVQMGDADNAAGLYRVTADGSTLEAVVTREMLVAGGLVSATTNFARSIGLMWFPDYIAWGVDEPDGYIVRMKRTEIGKAAPVIELMYGLTSGGWGSVKASADGSTWLSFGSAEQAGGIALDRNMHIYAVTDQGATVFEVGSIPAAGQDFAAPAAVGQAEIHSDVLWFGTRGMDVGVIDRYYKAQYGLGVHQIGSTNSARPLYYGTPDTISGRGTVTTYTSAAAHGGYTVGYTRAPLTARRLYVINGGVHSISGTCRIRVYRKDLPDTDANRIVFNSTAKTARGGIGRLEASEYLTSVQVPGDTDIEIRIEDNTGAGPGEATGYVTLAWGM